jgi:rifampicin phosphotransferase
MTGIILDWAAAREAGPARAGGKGWQLGLLAHLGAPVPEGFVVDATASLRRRHGDPVPATELSNELASRGWNDRALAVRSSACVEDSASASFAGIFTSCLNVSGADAVVRAVQEVWDSVWTPSAQAYMQRLGMSTDEVAIAVVVMPLVSAVAAGVAFTCDPITGREDQLVIHANWGLGEALVDGKTEGDEYRFEEGVVDNALTLVEQRIGSKVCRSEVSPGGGTRLGLTPHELATQPVLSADQASTLALLVRDVASALDYATPFYDIEWVWDGKDFWIVQARPITVRGRLTYPVLESQPAIWSRGNSRDVIPDPLSPLDWSMSRVLNRMLTLTVEAGGYRPLVGAQRTSLRHGRVYFECATLQWEAFDAFDVAPKAYNQLLGGHQPEIAVPQATVKQHMVRAWRSVRFLLGCIRPRMRAKSLFARVHRRTTEQLQKPAPGDNAALARELHHQVSVIRTADDLWILQAAGSALFILLDLLEKYFPGEGQSLTASLLTGGEPSVTAAQAYELMRLAGIASSDPTALAWLSSVDRVGTQWRHLPATSPFRQAFAGFLQVYGHRGVYESYLRNPRWREVPDYVLDNIVNLIGSDLARLRERQKEIAARAGRRLKRALPIGYRLVVPLLVKFATVERNIREGARSALMANFGVVRHLALELGARLRGEPDGLAETADVFNLTLLELIAIAEGRMSPSIGSRRARWRRSQLERHSMVTPPEVIIEHGGTAKAAPAPAEVGLSPAGGAGVDTAGWRGTVVGSGLARGIAHVARHPTEALNMAAGAILVAPSTDPSWTPVFLKASALVMETGGYMSHGAIVAREFGLPAVVNLPGILEQVRSGDPLEVDGNRGVVRRLRGASVHG